MSSYSMKTINPATKEFKIDPVCSMKVDSSKSPFQARYQGENHYFCSEVCKHLFEREPGKYIRPSHEQ